jgi:hypothetical protein
MTPIRLPLLALVLALAACSSSSSPAPVGSSDGGGSDAAADVGAPDVGTSAGGNVCDWVANGMRITCIDFAPGWPASSEAMACVSPAMLVPGPCPHAGAAGGCTQHSGPYMETIWSYANQTPASVMADCARNNGTFVAP